jgi:hypothetical protein
MLVGDASLLHSRYRDQLCRRRDYLKESAPKPALTRDRERGQIHANAQLASPVFAAKGVADGKLVVMFGFGDEVDDATVYGMSITEAREFVRMLQAALDAPSPRLAED